jgi:hypothetical protein
MDAIEQEIAKREFVEQAKDQIHEALKQSGVDVDVVDSIELIRLDPKEHSYDLSTGRLGEFIKNERAGWCFTFGGFEDIFTGFVLIVPESERTHKNPSPNAFWMTCVNQFGMIFTPPHMTALGVKFEEVPESAQLDSLLTQMIDESDQVFMEFVAGAARTILNLGRAQYVERANELLAQHGKPPMVVL